MSRSWTCPYCNRPTTLGAQDHYDSYSHCKIVGKDTPIALKFAFVVCPNVKCKRLTLSVATQKLTISPNGALSEGEVIKVWRLMPQGSAKCFPDFVPISIRNDYEEACAIQELSPKAAATLARRALQGVVRDFWSGKGKDLFHEIESVKDSIEPELYEAIEAVRNVGNIGAHMEKDIDLIINVDPSEAGSLIGLVEMLIDETYVAREIRRQKIQGVKEIAAQKKKLKEDHKTNEEKA